MHLESLALANGGFEIPTIRNKVQSIGSNYGRAIFMVLIGLGCAITLPFYFTNNIVRVIWFLGIVYYGYNYYWKYVTACLQDIKIRITADSILLHLDDEVINKKLSEFVLKYSHGTISRSYGETPVLVNIYKIFLSDRKGPEGNILLFYKERARLRPLRENFRQEVENYSRFLNMPPVVDGYLADQVYFMDLLIPKD